MMEQSIIEQLERIYDLTIVDTPVQLGGLSNKNYAITTDKGKKVVKKYINNDIYRIEIEHAVLQHLEQKEFPYFAKPLVKKDKSHIEDQNIATLVNIEGDYYALFEFKEGRPYQNTFEETLDAGRKLGLLHQALTDFDIEEKYGKHTKKVEILDKWLLEIESYDNLNDTEINRAIEPTLDIIRTLKMKETSDENMVSHHFHADYHLENIIYNDKGNVNAIIDFEASHKSGQRVIDLAFGAYNFSVGPTTDLIREMDLPKYLTFIKGYHETNPLSPTEIEKLVDALICHRAEYLSFYIEEAKKEKVVPQELKTKILETASHIAFLGRENEYITFRTKKETSL